MNFNPFDFRGPQFLVFYLILMAVTAVIARWFRRNFLEPTGGTREDASATQLAEDPYRIAYLRGGRSEIIRVSIISLLERGLLKPHGENLVWADRNAVDKVRRDLDKAVLMVLAADGDARKLYSQDLVVREADQYGLSLERLGLLPDENCRQYSRILFAFSLLFLWFFSITKMVVAVSRGHSNIAFLIILSFAAIPILLMATMPRTTSLGGEIGSGVKNLFSRLYSRRGSLHLHKTTSELTFLAAVFGIAALPDEVTKIIKPLHLQPASGNGSGCGSGSSCGGGGCGGGGCGGGCGGCS